MHSTARVWMLSMLFGVFVWVAWGTTNGVIAQNAPSGRETHLININRASATELEQLPGIGPKLAARIVAYREEHGPFQRKEELLNVPGIGMKKFARIKDRITVK